MNSMNVQRIDIRCKECGVLLRHLFTLAMCMCFGACQSTGSPYSGPSALVAGDWHRVSASPPTYFPEGIARDHPTDFRGGLWVYAGDSQGTRFFIPTGGADDLTEEALTAQAFGAMHPSKKKALEGKWRTGQAAKKTGQKTGQAAKKTWKVAAPVLGGFGSALGGV